MNAIQLENVSKKFKGFEINDINLQVPKGYVTGFIGPNGAGKSTIIKLVMDVLKPDHGQVHILGKYNSNTDIKQKIGFVYDTLYLYEDFNIKKAKSFIAPLYPTWDEELYDNYLAKFRLPVKKKIKKFSQGMKMKASLLFALSHRPEIIIMDEPTSGLDPIFRRELLDELHELMVNENQTIFFSTHITQDLDQIADYIIFINEGEIQFQKTMEEIRDNYYLVKGSNENFDSDLQNLLLGYKKTSTGFVGLIEGKQKVFTDLESDFILERATLEDIMYYTTRREWNQ